MVGFIYLSNMYEWLWDVSDCRPTHKQYVYKKTGVIESRNIILPDILPSPAPHVWQRRSAMADYR